MSRRPFFVLQTASFDAFDDIAAAIPKTETVLYSGSFGLCPCASEMRRGHKKTRTGCTQCKRRRVKCDERKPLCSNCERLKLQCSLEFLTPMAFSSRSVSGTKGAHIMSAPNLSLELLPSTSDLRTNELLHHYRTTLYASVADDCPPTVWCVAIPQLGLEHPFILSGLLAISALHLASMVPQRRQELHILAFAQQSLALPSFRSVMRSPKPENIPAIFIFAASIVYYVMASPDQVDRCRLPRRNDEHPHWFQTMRGFTTLLGNHRTQLAGGPLGALVHFKDGKNHAPEYPDDGQLAKLHGMFSSDMSSSTPLSERIVENCKEALEDLRQIAGLSYSATSFNGKTFACMWPGDVSQEFAELVYDRDPRALVIMAHYCVLLKRLDYVWFLESLGTGLLENIRQALAEEWLPWIAWALEQPVLTN